MAGNIPQCGEYRLSNRLSLIRRIGGFKCSGEGRSKIVFVWLSQTKMALHLQRMLAPVLTPAAVVAQGHGPYVDLVGDERDQGGRRNLVMTPASAEMAHEAELDGEAELVVGRRLRPDEIEVRLPQRVVADQGLLVRWRAEKRRPMIGFEQGSLRHGSISQIRMGRYHRHRNPLRAMTRHLEPSKTTSFSTSLIRLVRAPQAGTGASPEGAVHCARLLRRTAGTVP